MDFLLAQASNVSICEINQMKLSIKYNNEYTHTLGFSDDSESKKSACNVGDLGLIPGLGRSPGEWHGHPLQYLCLENPHGQRSLLDYSPWGRKESDETEHNIVNIHTEKLYHTEETIPSFLNWSTVDLQNGVIFRCAAKWFSYMCVCVCVCVYLFHILFHHRLLQYIEYSSLYSMVGPCCLSVICRVVRIC